MDVMPRKSAGSFACATSKWEPHATCTPQQHYTFETHVQALERLEEDRYRTGRDIFTL
jgi:hypothetical protein